MTLTLPARRKFELQAKLKSLRSEIQGWVTRTESDPLRRHHSQVRRIDATLNGLLDSMEKSQQWTQPSDEIVLAKASAWEIRILLAHSIWEVFRSKLGLRSEKFFGDKLAAWDDLAWACYEPALKHFSNSPKEPPLVYLRSTWSPFLRSRDSAFQTEIVAGLDAGDALNDPDYQSTISRLPIPLLGLPRFQVAHLASALLIGHEIGHLVEFDFGLTTTITRAISAAALDFDTDWRSWSSEVFADLYGCLCFGHYFAGALIDLLVAEKNLITTQQPGSGKYPPRALRVEVVASALEDLQLNAQATAVRKSWRDVYGPLHTPSGYADDIPKLVQAIYGQQGMNLAAILRPPSANISAVAQQAAQNRRAELTAQTDARVLFCAARHIYENYSPQDLEGASDLLIEQVVRGYANQFRYRGERVKTKEELEQRLPTLLEQDFASGQALEKELNPESV